MKGKELLEYTVAMASEDYLNGLKLLAEDILGFGIDALKLCNLVHPVALSEYIFKLLLEVPNLDQCLIDYLKRNNIPIPERWAWKHTMPWKDEPEIHRYKERHKCYADMYEKIHESTECAWESTSEPIIIQSDDKNEEITIRVGEQLERFELYKE